MKRMILVLLVGLVMFGGSAGVSWYIRRAEMTPGGEANPGETSHGGDRFRLAIDEQSASFSGRTGLLAVLRGEFPLVSPPHSCWRR